MWTLVICQGSNQGHRSDDGCIRDRWTRDDACVLHCDRGFLAPADIAGITRDEPVYLSPVTIAELKFGAEVAASAGIRQKRLAAIHRLKKKPILRIDETTGEVFGTLAASLRANGQEDKYRVQDLWLASQAIQHGLSFLTHNRKDFEGISGLSLVVPEIRSTRNST